MTKALATVCVLYGVATGDRVTKRLRRALVANGFKVIGDPGRADIIVTHSGGSLLLPEKVRAKQIIQIAPFWQGQPYLLSLFKQHFYEWQEFRRKRDSLFWYYKFLWQCLHFFNVLANADMIRGLRNDAHLRHGGITLIVRPKFDPYCFAEKMPKFDEEPALLSFPGYHDDIWRDPEPYLALLKKGP